MTRTLADTTEIHAKENTYQQEKKATDNPGPIRNVHLFAFTEQERPTICEAFKVSNACCQG